MKLPLAYYGDPILRQKCKPINEITPEIRQLVDDMIDTLEAQKGVGLAAPQINQPIALFITQAPSKDPNNPDKWIPGELIIFINPKIISYSDDTSTYGQGCLSIPKVYGDVTRPFKIVVTASDLEGKEFTKEFTDFEAQAVMHENDHINGVLFIDRLDLKERKKLEPQLRELKKNYDMKKRFQSKS